MRKIFLSHGSIFSKRGWMVEVDGNIRNPDKILKFVCFFHLLDWLAVPWFSLLFPLPTSYGSEIEWDHQRYVLVVEYSRLPPN